MPNAAKNSSGEKVKKDEPKWNGAGDSGRPLREILYLDLNRITSYLSQLQEGLAEHQDRLQLDSKSKSQPGAKFGANFGINAELNLGGASTVDALLLLERKRQHHLALNILEEVLEEREVIGREGETKPFLRVSGYPFFIDYSDISHRVGNAGKLREALEALAKQSTPQRSESKHDRNARIAAERSKRENEDRLFKNYASALEVFGDRIDLFFHEEKVTATLERNAMLVTPELIEPLYGSPIRAETTLIGLNMSKPHREVAPSPGKSIAETAMFIQNLYASKVNKALNADVGFKKMVPVAAYIEVDTTTES